MFAKQHACKVDYTKSLIRLLKSKDDQRDFREFLYPMGIPDLLLYVEFVLETKHFDHKICTRGERESLQTQLVNIHNRFMKLYAIDKLNSLDLSTKILIDFKITKLKVKQQRRNTSFQSCNLRRGY